MTHCCDLVTVKNMVHNILVVWQWILLYLLSDGSRLNRLWLWWVLSCSIFWALCRHFTSLMSLMGTLSRPICVIKLRSFMCLEIVVWPEIVYYGSSYFCWQRYHVVKPKILWHTASQMLLCQVPACVYQFSLHDVYTEALHWVNHLIRTVSFQSFHCGLLRFHLCLCWGFDGSCIFSPSFPSYSFHTAFCQSCLQHGNLLLIPKENWPN